MDTDTRILVAGATGVVGRRIVESLTENGTTVFGLARSERSARLIRRLGAVPVGGDALDRDAVDRVVRQTRPDTIIHQLTAIPPGAVNPRRMGEAFAATNELRRTGTRNLVRAAERHGVQRVVAQSIAFAYPAEGPMIVDEDAPLDMGARGGWGEIVRAVADLEEAVLSGRNFVGVVLRYGGFYGPGTGMTPGAEQWEALQKRKFPLVGDGGGVWSFIHIEDAAAATAAALENWTPGETYNVCDDDPAPVREWLPVLAAAASAPPPRRVPAWLLRPIAPHLVTMMCDVRGASNAKARRALSWSPARASWRQGFPALGE